MRNKTLFIASVFGLCFSAAWLPRIASAALRHPQVPVLGTVLQSYLTSVGDVIDVNTDQVDIQRFAPSDLAKPTYTVQIELSQKTAGVSVGVYNASDTSPVLYPLFPSESAPLWFCVASFRTAPARLVVSLFDANATSRGVTTHLGADKNDFAFYLSGPDGVFYTQDVRNPGGNAQWLTFHGTGIRAGNWWLAAEAASIAGGGSDQGFDDAVLFYELPPCFCSEVQRASWSALKSRFR